MTSGTIFFVCSTSWVSRCSLAAISSIFFLIRSESRAPCQREGKKRLPVKAHRWRNRSQWFRRMRDPLIWCHTARWVRGKIFRIISGQGSQSSTRKLVRAVNPRTEFQNMKHTQTINTWRRNRRWELQQVVNICTWSIFSKTSIWKQFAGKHSRLQITLRDDPIHHGMRRRNFRALGFGWFELQNKTWRERRFRADHCIKPRIHTFLSKPTIQSLCSKSWWNTCRTSHWSSNLENSWQLWIWNCNSITKQFKTNSLCSDIQRKESVRARIAYSHCRTQTQRGMTLWTEGGGNWTSLGAVQDARPGDWCGLSHSFAQPSVLVHTKNHSYDRKEEESYSCQFTVWRALPTAVSKMVTRLVGHYDQDERQSDATIHWVTIRPVLLTALANQWARDFSDKDWLRLIHQGSSKTEVRELWVFHKFVGLLSSNSRTLWWNNYCNWVDGAHSDSLQLEEIYFSQEVFFAWIFGQCSDQNSCDYWAETFGERTVWESQLFWSLFPCCCLKVFWSIEILEYFKHAL